MRILIAGGSGLLGKKLLTKLSSDHEVGGTYLTKPFENCKQLDLTDKNSVQQFVDLYRPDAIIHTAAVTDADFCEENKEMAWRVNVEGTKNLVECCKKYQIKFVYISSDYVFDGKNAPYDERAEPNPVNFYGLTKLEGERIIKEELLDYIIIRPTILYGYNDGSDETFISFIRQGIPRGSVEVDNYVKKYPLLIDDISSLIKLLLENDESGIFHIGSENGVTRYEWALIIAEAFDLDKSKIRPIEAKYKAPRPHDAPLRSIKLQKLGLNPIILKEGLLKVKMQEHCMFKLLYSSEPTESVLGMNVALGRMELGKMLAREAPTVADMAVPIPETGILYALGYSDESGIPLRFGVIRKKYSKKTLFESAYKRVNLVGEKLSVIPEIVKGKRVVLIDEAVLSGLTLRVMTKKIRESGAQEIHVRIPSPPIKHGCPAGEHPPFMKLLFHGSKLNGTHFDLRMIEAKLSKQFDVDSFKFLTPEALSNRFPTKCTYCLNKEFS